MRRSNQRKRRRREAAARTWGEKWMSSDGDEVMSPLLFNLQKRWFPEELLTHDLILATIFRSQDILCHYGFVVRRISKPKLYQIVLIYQNAMGHMYN